MEKNKSIEQKKEWRTPELTNLGNFPEFVRWGERLGKSGAEEDGGSGETMD